MLPRMYYRNYAAVDEDDFDALALIKEGFQAAAGVFLTSWVLSYTIMHVDKLHPA